MLIVTVLGVRPHYVKAAGLSRLFKSAGFRYVFADIGQHFDTAMRDTILDEYGVSVVTLFSAQATTNGAQRLGQSVAALADYVSRLTSPCAVLALGDADPALAAALVANRLRVPLAHLEAGVRRTDLEYEHWNSLICDRLADLRFCYSPFELEELQSENLGTNSFVVGDILLDLCTNESIQSLDRNDWLLVTIHRPQNCTPVALKGIVDGVRSWAGPVVWVTHPRNGALVRSEFIPRADDLVLDPQPHKQMISHIRSCAAVLTDSGGVIREAVALRKPVTAVHGSGMWKGLVTKRRIALAEPSASSVSAALVSAGACDLSQNIFSVDGGAALFLEQLTTLCEKDQR